MGEEGSGKVLPRAKVTDSPGGRQREENSHTQTHKHTLSLVVFVPRVCVAEEGGGGGEKRKRRRRGPMSVCVVLARRICERWCSARKTRYADDSLFLDPRVMLLARYVFVFVDVCVCVCHALSGRTVPKRDGGEKREEEGGGSDAVRVFKGAGGARVPHTGGAGAG